MRIRRVFRTKRNEFLTLLDDGSFISEMRPISFSITGSGIIEVAPGWLFCNGATLSRTIYKRLFDEIGTSYNIGGEAGTDFRIPDLRGRAPLAHADGKTGADRVANAGSVGNATVPGAIGGVDVHSLTKANTPTHNHGQSFAITGGSHSHTPGSLAFPMGTGGGGANGFREAGGGPTQGTAFPTGTLGAASHTHANGNFSGASEDGTATGLSGSSHENAHPHLSVGGMVIRS